MVLLIGVTDRDERNSLALMGYELQRRRIKTAEMYTIQISERCLLIMLDEAMTVQMPFLM